MPDILKRIDGVVIGIFLGFDASAPLVVFVGNPKDHGIRARSLIELTSDMIGAEVALLFESGEATRPLIVGRIVDPTKGTRPTHVIADGKYTRISGEDRVELRCGKATIILEKDGHITIRGTYVTSHASATNRIRGGSVNLN
ncbi:hypothetical protein FJV83_09425 [Mesorhizobium sp. WSM4307]|uniref:DUF6484 domain-containing protein n=1 Tax=unclassified Mesorhizobium TaxID=325217 RepID=UPI00115DDE45|nr:MULTISPECIES: DUF6484 domain-containing protein [unclassified Mesorhizobium]TRC70811.1 hypothetical protein FJV81_35205 [Mesorhizobium sp. WSM4315]TRC86591.1 hypothetical protein FJV83_09425 [Mesorhizobium sp. WSM4307]